MKNSGKVVVNKFPREIVSGSCSGSKSRSVLNAVALQDHLVRSLSLQDPIKIRNEHVSKSNTKKKANSGRKTKTHMDGNREYVLDAKPKALTLAQRLGLVDAPSEPLNDKEWQVVKNKSNQRNDSNQPCVICKEEFGTQHQVLLSCSHVFHRVCLEAFEKFSGGKTCPLCRKEQYETRVIHEGRKMWQHKCAIKIQAAWRGYVVRSWYLKLRETVPPNNPRLRRKFYEEKLRSITDRFVTSMSNADVDSFLAQIDESVEESRRVMRFVGEDSFKTMSDADWESVYEQAKDRLSSDCPICFTILCSGITAPELLSRPDVRPVVLLSCSHVFHKNCVDSFEQLSLNSSPICPVCRSPYYKKDI
ncbi:RING finger protein 32-like [Dendronephthya gigantea]|uniref:RING finger protein 32-like n=1 Tax=Dendronephthya gigantea TaxID=151771 RepID=UPI00106B9D92|nr:RING finger protein 32-like [Dendronephthya gigantea]XP_028394253.1 RING finger protein 32-like [Dendronephthya gigantea]XP_028394262.1 RING finger protein 32-like [Dendronephthya gigantea]